MSKARVVYALGTLFHISDSDEFGDEDADCYLFLSLGGSGYLRIWTDLGMGDNSWGKLRVFPWQNDEEATAHLPDDRCRVNTGDWDG
jgi:hypothetical protein